MRTANLALRFILELCALTALAYWGYNSATSVAVRLVLTLSSPILAAILWWAFIAPAAPARMPDPWRLLAEVLLFALAAADLAASGQPITALIFTAAVLLNEVLMFVWDQRG